MLYKGVSNTIKEHLLTVLEKIRDVPIEGLLNAIKTTWNEFKATVINVSTVLMYMDKTYVKPSGKLPTYDLALKHFLEVIIYHDNIRDRMKRVLLENVAAERAGHLIDRDLMRSIAFMLVELGRERDGVLAYEDEFEEGFLEETKQFYVQESQSYLSECTVPEYMRKAETRILEENNRAGNYLNPSTCSKLLCAVEAELITVHAHALVNMETSGCHPMFQDNQTDSLKRMYNLFHRVPETLDILRDYMGQYIKKAGVRIVVDAENQKNPVRFAQQMLDLRTKFNAFILESFRGEKKALRSLKSAFEEFVNQDSRCASHLASFADDMMKNSLKDVSEAEADTQLHRFIELFRYLTDKDVFEHFYKGLLSKRLLSGKSISSDLEKTMIAKLKAECGYQFTSKLEGMFTDMQLSKGVNTDFRDSEKYSQLPARVELDVHMLTAGYWPIKALAPCRLPPLMNACGELFSSFYLNKYQGRKMQWVTHHGTADIKANYSEGRKDFIVSTYQMCILMLFNATPTMSLEEISNGVSCQDDIEFKRHLLSLCTPKLKILHKKSKGKGILENDEFSFNDSFSSKFKRIKVPLISIKEVSGGDDNKIGANGDKELPVAVEEDRRHLIEASIVRIMKTRKTLLHNELIAEATRQLQARFNPTPIYIKKRIESLIEREFLDRDKDDPRLYTYLA